MRKPTQFIPLTLVATGKPFFAEWALPGVFSCIGGMLITGALLVGMRSEFRYVDFRGSLPFLIVAEAVQVYVWTLILRKVCLKENSLKPIYAMARKHRITDLSSCWGVYEIDDSKIMFLDGTAGVLVKMTRSYVYGRPDYFEEDHFDKLSRFIRVLVRAGLSYRFYNIVVNDANLDPLLKTEAIINKDKTTGIYDLESQVIKYIREVATDLAETEIDYYLIKCQGAEYLDDMLQTVKSAIDELDGSLYASVEIANARQIYDFQEECSGVSYINIPKMIKQAFAGVEKKVIWVDEIIYDDDASFVKKHQIEANQKYETSAFSEEDTEKYRQMQEANKLANQKEYEAKVNYVLQAKGVNLKRLSKKKYEKLRAGITPEEFAKAETVLNQLRLNRLLTSSQETSGSSGGVRTAKSKGSNIYVDLHGEISRPMQSTSSSSRVQVGASAEMQAASAVEPNAFKLDGRLQENLSRLSQLSQGTAAMAGSTESDSTDDEEYII